MPPDTYKSQHILKMAFLQDMLESENVTETEIRGAFEGALTDYLKVVEVQA
ncbi:MAG: hypothetical protein GWP10_06375 [Nitrospiraceae bacterium]|nr:hypothetical protein [Nitrospiraceae bacterium]